MNKVILKQMIRLSRVIKDIKEGRCKLNSVMSQCAYFIVEGEYSDFIRSHSNASISSCLYMEQYLRLSVSNACTCLDGFNKSLMDPVDYISSSDVKNKVVDICRGKKVVATIDLTTGLISSVVPEQEDVGEDKSSAENS